MTTKMREEFEKWAKGQGFTLNGDGPDRVIELMFWVWSAAACVERKACAHEGWMAASSDCEDRVRAAIRARGEE